MNALRFALILPLLACAPDSSSDPEWRDGGFCMNCKGLSCADLKTEWSACALSYVTDPDYSVEAMIICQNTFEVDYLWPHEYLEGSLEDFNNWRTLFGEYGCWGLEPNTDSSRQCFAQVLQSHLLPETLACTECHSCDPESL